MQQGRDLPSGNCRRRRRIGCQRNKGKAALEEGTSNRGEPGVCPDEPWLEEVSQWSLSGGDILRGRFRSRGSCNQRNTERRCVGYECSSGGNLGEGHEETFGPGVGRLSVPPWDAQVEFYRYRTSRGFQVNCFRKLNLAAGFAGESRGREGQVRGHMVEMKGLVVRMESSGPETVAL